ncbi:MAG: DAK2 domain-containing protein [Anaerolineae bacterium]
MPEAVGQRKADGTMIPLQAISRRTCDGQELKRLVGAGTAWLEKNAARVNALNVFPVPDGDTGTNMLLTMQAAMAEIATNPSHHVGEIARGISQGALMGARGNSGVILSQILRGFSRALEETDAFTTYGFAIALREGSNTAYKAVTNAVEGTILTVIREVADEAEASVKHTDDLMTMLERVVEAADEAVEKTPSLLTILRDAGVVDAGGLGLQLIFEGALRYMRGEPLEIAIPMEATQVADVPPAGIAEMAYGYCTEFVLQGPKLDYEQVKQDLLQMGDSALIVGDEYLIRVHIHTFRPGQVLDYATERGTLHKIKIDNMQEQHEHFVGLELTEAETDVPEAKAMTTTVAVEELSGIAVIAVVPGPGLEDVYKSMGASAVIRGGQTMNPSTQEMLEAIASVNSDQIILLPNNKNVLMVAEQAVELADREVRVVPTHTVPQGIAALLALNYQAGLDENTEAMARALHDIQTGEVTRAVRSVRINGVDVEEGAVIGLVNGQLVACNNDTDDMVLTVLDHTGADQYEIITLFYGEDVSPEQAEAVGQRVRETYPAQEVEVVSGGQPYYHYILSAE